MSDKDFEFDLEDILAEFSSKGVESPAQPESPPPAQPLRPTMIYAPEPGKVPDELTRKPAAAVRPAPQPQPEFRQEPQPQPEPQPESRPAVQPRQEAASPRPERRTPPPARRPAPPVEEDEEEEEERPARSRFETFLIGLGRSVCGLIFAALGLVVLAWMLLHVHPDLGAAAASSPAASTKLNFAAELDAYANNAASDALNGLTYIRKIYTIPENATVAPVPNPEGFHITYDPQEVMDVIASASALLEGQTMSFDPNADFQADRPIRYYYDETILAVVWKEIINGKCCTCAEVKVADGSQIRRKLADDSYGSSIQLYATAMSKEANSVVTLSGDFYAFRDLGITVYQRQVYRCNPAQVDSCFVTASGDLIFSYAGDLMEKETAQAFVDENDVLFAVAFGPILIDNGELRDVASLTSYPIGEINRTYSRTGLGTLGKLHYFCMTINYDDNYTVAATLPELAQFMYDKGCVQAYNLDGGQTSVIAFQGEAINHIDNINGQSERVVSDIIYFASALPEEEAAS